MTALTTDPLDVVRTALSNALAELGEAQDPCPPGLARRLDHVVTTLANMRSEITGPLVHYRAYDEAGRIREALTGRLVHVAGNAHGDISILMPDGLLIERATTDVQGVDRTDYTLERLS